ncbi:hypothetical protein G6F31_018612 [Rhizopus arrhizus]|nr:hypothetical protein G6F31_018612 [Rhizopus arrhizus]
MVGSAIAAAGTPAQREALEGLSAGAITAALAQAEPESGYDLAQVRTRAERSGEGWVLNGAKAVVTAGEHADLFLVSARTAGAEDDEAGISLFLVSAGTPGLSVRGYGLIDGGRAAEQRHRVQVALEGHGVARLPRRSRKPRFARATGRRPW